jgi:thioredoxin-like negative regulator of GroEL
MTTTINILLYSKYSGKSKEILDRISDIQSNFKSELKLLDIDNCDVRKRMTVSRLKVESVPCIIQLDESGIKKLYYTHLKDMLGFKPQTEEMCAELQASGSVADIAKKLAEAREKELDRENTILKGGRNTNCDSSISSATAAQGSIGLNKAACANLSSIYD